MNTNQLFALLALIGITAAVYIYWPDTSAEARIRNETAATVAVRLESDAGALYPVSMVAAGANATIALSGKDQQLWAIALYADGQSRESRKVRANGQKKWAVTIRNDAVEIAAP